MSGTKKKRKVTSANTESPSAKRPKSSKIPTRSTSKTQQKTTKKERGSSALRRETQNTSSSFSATEASKKDKKSIALSQRGGSRQKKKGTWEDFDSDDLPELSKEQIKDLLKKSMTRDEWLKSRKNKKTSGKRAS